MYPPMSSRPVFPSSGTRLIMCPHTSGTTGPPSQLCRSRLQWLAHHHKAQTPWVLPTMAHTKPRTPLPSNPWPPPTPDLLKPPTKAPTPPTVTTPPRPSAPPTSIPPIVIQPPPLVLQPTPFAALINKLTSALPPTTAPKVAEPVASDFISAHLTQKFQLFLLNERKRCTAITIVCWIRRLRLPQRYIHHACWSAASTTLFCWRRPLSFIADLNNNPLAAQLLLSFSVFGAALYSVGTLLTNINGRPASSNCAVAHQTMPGNAHQYTRHPMRVPNHTSPYIHHHHQPRPLHNLHATPDVAATAINLPLLVTPSVTVLYHCQSNPAPVVAITLV